jgi:hypothetical protein
VKEFIDKTAGQSGTKINRKNMLAVQGFLNNTTVFQGDNRIIETNSDGETLTTIFNSDGTITEIFVGEKTITKTTSFLADGSIVEVLS